MISCNAGKESRRQRVEGLLAGGTLTAAPLSIVAANRMLESTRCRAESGFGDWDGVVVLTAEVAGVRAGGWAPPKVQEPTAGSYEARAVGSR